MRNILIPAIKLFTALTFTSCEDLIEVGVPRSKVESKVIFSSDVTAIAAVTGIYVHMMDLEGFASGRNNSVPGLAGLSSDELKNFPETDAAILEFERASLLPKNTYVHNLWASMYKSIFEANAALEGLTGSIGVSQATKDQLMGEAFFVRAFCHFYLVNLFGDVPLVTSSDYRVNAMVSRTPQASVYEQITADLKMAQSLLSDTYVTTERVRPNKATATALLARAYLYTHQWDKAEDEASAIISDQANYSLTGLTEVFLKNSAEAIWQLRPLVPGNTGYTPEAYFFSPEKIIDYNVLHEQLVNAFEKDDRRGSTWIDEYAYGGVLLYRPTKYNQYRLDQPLSEYSMVLRLAEQYLIRAEARAQQGQLAGALQDLNMIRDRAGLPLLQHTNPGMDQPAVLMAIEQERRAELFTEWGHRWLDLKRTGRADAVLGPLKTSWTTTDQRYPIPESEFIKNPKLGDQNDGY